GVEALLPALKQDGDEIDHHIGVAYRSVDRGGIAHIGLHRVDLANAAHRLQEAGEGRPAPPDPGAIAALGHGAHQVAAQEARAAEDRNQGVELRLRGHAAREYRMAAALYRGPGAAPRPARRGRRALTSRNAAPYLSRRAQVAELVDALVSGTSGESRGGSSPLLGTKISTHNPLPDRSRRSRQNRLISLS